MDCFLNFLDNVSKIPLNDKLESVSLHPLPIGCESDLTKTVEQYEFKYFPFNYKLLTIL